MNKSYTKKDLLMGFILLIIVLGIRIILSTAVIGQDPLYKTKIQAYEYMEELMKTVSKYKQELNIDLSQEDIHKTGMIGQSNSPITTSLGSIEAKRTSANPDMAALVVELLHKARVKSGDRIGANFSGSFPSLNLAVLSACKAMKVEISYITSIGSSNFGANDPELTFPDMAIKLASEGLIKDPGVAFSIGGTNDNGLEMDGDILSNITNRLKSSGLNHLNIQDYKENLNIRKKLLERDGSISCFVNVGGNTTSLGKGEASIYFGQGLLTEKPIPITEKSGLIEIYRNQGTPVIHLLNLKKLTADYGMAYDPVVLPPKGTSSLYVKSSYNHIVAIVFIGVSLLGLIIYRKLKFKKDPNHKGEYEVG
ncbi:MAG: poly-gamma-glutamate system protein [Tissierellaceae bacterium]|nr:poly-gamma-glutamate system protein [Tissierellaceae bacterium]